MNTALFEGESMLDILIWSTPVLLVIVGLVISHKRTKSDDSNP